MSGWQTFTVNAVDETSAEEIADRFNDAAPDEYDEARVEDGATVRGIEWGYGANKMKNILFDRTHLWTKAVLMNCNDTADAGDGTAYAVEDGTMKAVDSSSGAESAMGYDAADDLRAYVDGYIEMR